MANVTLWLEALNLAQYGEIFVAHGYDDVECLAAITMSDLERMDVKLGHRRKILAAAEQLRADALALLAASAGVDPTTYGSVAAARAGERAPHVAGARKDGRPPLGPPAGGARAARPLSGGPRKHHHTPPPPPPTTPSTPQPLPNTPSSTISTSPPTSGQEPLMSQSAAPPGSTTSIESRLAALQASARAQLHAAGNAPALARQPSQEGSEVRPMAVPRPQPAPRPSPASGASVATPLVTPPGVSTRTTPPPRPVPRQGAPPALHRSSVPLEERRRSLLTPTGVAGMGQGEAIGSAASSSSAAPLSPPPSTHPPSVTSPTAPAASSGPTALTSAMRRRSNLEDDLRAALPELSAEEKQSRISEAMEKMRRAQVIELLVEIRHPETGGRQVISLDSRRSAMDAISRFCTLAAIPFTEALTLWEVWDEPPLERPLEPSEHVLEVTATWPRGAVGNTWMELRPATSAAEAWQEGQFPTMEGWMHKTEAKGKGWKHRYFVLKPDGLAFYKSEPADASAAPLGLVKYHHSIVYVVRRKKKMPTKACFCLRQRGLGGNPTWPATLDEVVRSFDECDFCCVDDVLLRDRWMTSVAWAMKAVSDVGNGAEAPAEMNT